MGRKEREAEAEPSLTRRRERLSDPGVNHGVDRPHDTRGRFYNYPFARLRTRFNFGFWLLLFAAVFDSVALILLFLRHSPLASRFLTTNMVCHAAPHATRSRGVRRDVAYVGKITLAQRRSAPLELDLPTQYARPRVMRSDLLRLGSRRAPESSAGDSSNVSRESLDLSCPLVCR